MHMAEGIHIAGRDKGIHPGAFFRQKAGSVFILLGAGEINLRMRGVKISADHNGLCPAQILRVAQKCVVKGQLVGDTPIFLAAVRKIDGKKVKSRIFQMQKASFTLEIPVGQFLADVQGVNTAEDRNA
jgi:hypothetical protein